MLASGKPTPLMSIAAPSGAPGALKTFSRSDTFPRSNQIKFSTHNSLVCSGFVVLSFSISLSTQFLSLCSSLFLLHYFSLALFPSFFLVSSPLIFVFALAHSLFPISSFIQQQYDFPHIFRHIRLPLAISLTLFTSGSWKFDPFFSYEKWWLIIFFLQFSIL